MTKKYQWYRLFISLFLSIAIFILVGCQKPQNVILFISDGCGYNQIAAASIYRYGDTAKQVYHQFPIKYGMSTYSLNYPAYNPHKAWESFNYVLNKPTDSAAAGTALAAGVKTYNGRIGVDSNYVEVKNVVEHFESLGKSTGVVTSVPFMHATPACFVVHDSSRYNYAALARKMITESAVDVIMGCGHLGYDKYGEHIDSVDYSMVEGEENWYNLVKGKIGSDANGDSIPDYWHFIDSRSEFQTLMTGPTPSRILGIPKTYNTLQENRKGDENADAFIVPFNNNVPTLVEMTRAALNILDENKKGFFLMVEGGAVDWACHGNLSGRMIEEEIDFDKSVEAAVEWVKLKSSWDETTIIVTADHETGYLTGPGSNDTSIVKEGIGLWKPLVNEGKGEMPGVQWNSHGHTNSLVPFFAKGALVEEFAKYAINKDPVRGAYLDNTNVGMFLLSISN